MEAAAAGQRRQQRQWPQVWQQPVECLNQSNSQHRQRQQQTPVLGATPSLPASNPPGPIATAGQAGSRAGVPSSTLTASGARGSLAARGQRCPSRHDQREEPRAGGRGQDQCRARAGQAAGRGEAGRRCRCKGRRGLGPHEALHRGGRGSSGSTGRARRHAGAAAEARGGRAQQQRRQPQPAAARERRAEEPAAGACR
ncbi:hypothetical protein COO60DRAFT_1708534 [Scenedesmus sp. NREL 46B-D3]|nr:hypothetical protein COO60DRAFT_1708534 [Scenedesmus sp. NREL 46B-D3]